MASSESGRLTLPHANAPLWRRLAAFAYDLLLLAAIVICFTLAVLAVRFGQPVPADTLWFELCLVLITMAFFCGFWAHGGQTAGMRAWRIRVVAADDTAPTLGAAALRFCVALVGLALLGLGLWWCLVDAHGRGWHDLAAHTRVVRV